MKIKGKIKVVKYLPEGVAVEIEAEQVIGHIKVTIPAKGVKFAAESPFEIDLKEAEEPKVEKAKAKKTKAEKE